MTEKTYHIGKTVRRPGVEVYCGLYLKRYSHANKLLGWYDTNPILPEKLKTGQVTCAACTLIYFEETHGKVQKE